MSNVQPGQMIGPYRILHQIGQGGMATVYKAYHAAMDRHVAVKILPRQLAESPEFLGRFRQEARTIARLEHAHILPVHDYGESDGFTYLVMRFLEAGTLKERLHGDSMPLAEVDRLFTQLADALDYAHAQGVIHRDLKPSNVLLDDRSNVFLTDFGIAKLLESDSKYTGTGAMIGTPAYMSPEQAQGMPVDRRADIYSLGVILYEMVTGRVPFDADTPLAIILKHLNDPLPLPSSLRPDLPPAIEAVLLKALSKDPAQRFATTGEFVSAWKAALPRAAPTMSADAAALGVPAAPARPTGGTPPPGGAASAPPARATGGTPPPSVPPGGPPSAPPVGPPSNPPSSSRPLTPLPVSGPASPPPLAAAAAGRKRSALLGPLGLLAALGLLLCAGLVCAAFVYNNIANRPRATATTGSGVVLSPAAGTPAAPSGGQGWTSWTSANIIYSVVFVTDTLITGGPGGLTRWNASGGVDERLNTGNGLPGATVFDLLFDPANNLRWVATDFGLYSSDGTTSKVYNDQNGLDSTAVTSLAQTSEGLLAGTAYSNIAGGGLLIFKDGGWQAVNDFPSAADDNQTGQLGNTINTIRVDQSGAWWVGTRNGLGRYDGASWTIFTTDDGLSDNQITSLGEVAGELWVGTNSGVDIFNGQSFIPLNDLSLSPIYSILVASDGSVWVTGGGGAARRAAGRTDWKVFDSRQMPSGTLYRAAQAPDGAVLIGSDDGLVRINGNDLSVWRVPNVPTYLSYNRILKDFNSDNLFFIREYGSEIDTFDVAQQSWSASPRLACGGCIPLLVDSQGRVWGGGNDGLWIAAGQTQQHLTATDGLPSDNVEAVAVTGSGAWIGTDAGAAVYDGQGITAVYTADSSGLSSDEIHALLADTAGGVWVAANTGLSYFNPDGQWQHFSVGSPFTQDIRVTNLAEDHDGAIWATTNGDGLYRYQSGNWQRFTASSTGGVAPIDDLNTITVAPDGSLWLGGYFSGAVHYSGGVWQAFGVPEGLIFSQVNDIFVRDNGEVWFATSGGISRYQP